MTAAARAAGVRTRALRLDPRAKLTMLAVANVLMFLHAGPAAQSLAVVLFSLPLLFGGKAAAGVRMLAVYGVLCAVEWSSVLGVDRLPWLHIAGATAAGVCMMMPCLTAGMAMFATTRPGDHGHVRHHAPGRHGVRDAPHARARRARDSRGGDDAVLPHDPP